MAGETFLGPCCRSIFLIRLYALWFLLVAPVRGDSDKHTSGGSHSVKHAHGVSHSRGDGDEAPSLAIESLRAQISTEQAGDPQNVATATMTAVSEQVRAAEAEATRAEQQEQQQEEAARVQQQQQQEEASRAAQAEAARAAPALQAVQSIAISNEIYPGKDTRQNPFEAAAKTMSEHLALEKAQNEAIAQEQIAEANRAARQTAAGQKTATIVVAPSEVVVSDSPTGDNQNSRTGSGGTGSGGTGDSRTGSGGTGDRETDDSDTDDGETGQSSGGGRSQSNRRDGQDGSGSGRDGRGRHGSGQHPQGAKVTISGVTTASGRGQSHTVIITGTAPTTRKVTARPVHAMPKVTPVKDNRKVFIKRADGTTHTIPLGMIKTQQVTIAANGEAQPVMIAANGEPQPVRIAPVAGTPVISHNQNAQTMIRIVPSGGKMVQISKVQDGVQIEEHGGADDPRKAVKIVTSPSTGDIHIEANPKKLDLTSPLNLVPSTKKFRFNLGQPSTNKGTLYWQSSTDAFTRGDIVRFIAVLEEDPKTKWKYNFDDLARMNANFVKSRIETLLDQGKNVYAWYSEDRPTKIEGTLFWQSAPNGFTRGDLVGFMATVRDGSDKWTYYTLGATADDSGQNWEYNADLKQKNENPPDLESAMKHLLNMGKSVAAYYSKIMPPLPEDFETEGYVPVEVPVEVPEYVPIEYQDKDLKTQVVVSAVVPEDETVWIGEPKTIADLQKMVDLLRVKAAKLARQNHQGPSINEGDDRHQGPSRSPNTPTGGGTHNRPTTVRHGPGQSEPNRPNKNVPGPDGQENPPSDEEVMNVMKGGGRREGGITKEQARNDLVKDASLQKTKRMFSPVRKIGKQNSVKGGNAFCTRFAAHDIEKCSDFQRIWWMSYIEDSWLQVGWLVVLLIVMLVVSILYCWLHGLLEKHSWEVLKEELVPGSREALRNVSVTFESIEEEQEATQEAVDQAANFDVKDAPWAYHLFFGTGYLGLFLDIFVVSIGVINWLVFAMATETFFEDYACRRAQYTFKWAVECHDTLLIVSISILFFIYVCRVIVVPWHPEWRFWGWKAVPMYVFVSVYSHMDLISIVWSAARLIFCIVENHPFHVNWAWFCLGRLPEMIGRRKWGIQLRSGQLHLSMKYESILLISAAVLGTVIIVISGGIYWSLNYDNPHAGWETAVSVFQHGTYWNRFVSIPSSLFICFINLCRRNPLAHVYTTWPQKLMVMICNLLIVPLFAIPSGIFANLLVKIVLHHGSADSSDDEDDEEDKKFDFLDDEHDEQISSNYQDYENDQLAQLLDQDTELEPYTRETEKVVYDLPFFALYKLTSSWGSFFTHLIIWRHWIFIRSGRLNQDMAIGWTTFSLILYSMTTGLGFSIFVRHIRMNCFVFMFIDAFVAMLFLRSVMMEFVDGQYFKRTTKLRLALAIIVDICCTIPSLVIALMSIFALTSTTGAGAIAWEFLMTQPGQWLRAFVVFRWMKLEKWISGFDDLLNVAHGYRKLLTTSFAAAFILIIFVGHMLYVTERDNVDFTMREQFATTARATFAAFIMLIGDFIWVDFSPLGRVVVVFAAVASMSLFLVPFTVLSAGMHIKLIGDFQILMRDINENRAFHWQLALRPMDNPSRDLFWTIFYEHLTVTHAQKTTFGYRFLKHFIISTVLLTIILIVIQCSKEFLELQSLAEHWSEVEHQGSSDDFNTLRNWKSFAPIAYWALYGVDLISFVIFLVEDAIRIYAVGWRWFFHSVGIAGVLSLIGHCVTLIPTLRLQCFEPQHYFTRKKMFVSICFGLVVPARILRFTCLDEYWGYSWVLHNIFRLVWNPLVRGFYMLLTVLFTLAALLHLMNQDQWQMDGVYPTTASNTLCMGLTLAERYHSFQASIQYALIHMTGTFAIHRYTMESQIVLVLGGFAGLVTLAAFQAVFSSGMVNWLRVAREEELQDYARLRLETKRTARVVLVIQRFVRRWRARRGQPPSMRQVVITYLNTSSVIRIIIQTNLLINLANTVFHSVPQVANSKHSGKVCFIVELCNSTIFIAEFVMYIILRLQWKYILFDFILLLPGPMTVMVLSGWSVANKSWWFGHTMDLLLILRSTKLLWFRAWVHQVQVIRIAIVEAGSMLMLPVWLSGQVLLIAGFLFTFGENTYHKLHPDKVLHTSHFEDLPESLYWMTHFALGDWEIVDFSPFGSLLCVIMNFLGMMLFAIPFGIITESVHAALLKDNLDTMEEAKLQAFLTGNDGVY